MTSFMGARFLRKVVFSIILITLSLLVLYQLRIEAKLKYRRVIYLDLLQNQYKEAKIDLLSIKRIESEHQCDCRKNVSIDIVKYSINSENETYAVNLLSDDYHVVKSYNLSTDFLETANYSCGLFNTFRRGTNQKVVSYSLYGQDTAYYMKIAKLARIIKQKYPEWIMRVYYDDTIDKSVICQIECSKSEDDEYLDHADFCSVNKIPKALNGQTWSAAYIHGMMWRWLPLGESFVDLFSSRDTDSPILDREVSSVNEWLNSSNLIHVMRDNLRHNMVILGGAWGFAPARNRSLANRIQQLMLNPVQADLFNFQLQNIKGLDQSFLRDKVWPLVRDNATIHDSYLCFQFSNSKPFPTKRLNPECYVGNFEWCNETAPLEPNNPDFVKFICPPQCRPKDHQDWIYC